jgi:1,4-dihydroxy-2-naphthoate polyprenyltransferase
MNESLGNLEPSASTLSGDSPGHTARRLLLATRPKFFTASLLPVVIGTGWGANATGAVDLTAFALAVAATVCVHAGANVLNDVWDDIGGSDRNNDGRMYPYTGGSRFIQNGVMNRAEMKRWGQQLLGAGVAFGIALTVLSGAGVVLFGLIGIGLAVLYSMPPVQLNARGLGEATVAIAFGVLPLTGAAWLQGAAVDPSLLVLALPPSLWTAAILLINEVPDVAADASAGKRTLAVRLGDGATARVYLGLHAGAAIAMLAVTLIDGLSVWMVIPPLALLIPAVSAARSIAGTRTDRAALRRGIEMTLAIHLLGGLWLGGLVWLEVL